TALEQEHRGQAQTLEARAIIDEVAALEAERTDRVALERVHAQRYDQQIRPVGTNMANGVIQRPRPGGIVRAGGHRVVDVETVASATAGFVGVAEKIRKRLTRIAVQRDKQH